MGEMDCHFSDPINGQVEISKPVNSESFACGSSCDDGMGNSFIGIYDPNIIIEDDATLLNDSEEISFYEPPIDTYRNNWNVRESIKPVVDPIPRWINKDVKHEDLSSFC